MATTFSTERAQSGGLDGHFHQGPVELDSFTQTSMKANESRQNTERQQKKKQNSRKNPMKPNKPSYTLICSGAGLISIEKGGK